MTIPESILTSLCWYDKRNPNRPDYETFLDAEEIPQPREGCRCDSCYYGKTPLAEHIISLIKRVNQLEKKP